MDAPASFSIFVRDLRDRTQCLAVGPAATLADVKELLQERTGVPAGQQLLDPVRACPDDARLAELGIGADSCLTLSGRLRGGKGGFGSLLRGAGKGAQTQNQDACRDLSGRRLRVVNAEKKLQEWAAGEAQRKREKEVARDAKERARAEQRAEASQAEADSAKQEQHVALNEAAKALRRSMQAGTKRLAALPAKPAAKRPRYCSDSEEGSSDDESGSDSEDLRSAEVAEPRAAEAPASQAGQGAQPTAAPAALQEAA